ncbi:hypothetical protein nbrc107696_35530 [Gordonia spumicola]|uniref:HTH marR-type domain-containing protein n=1 Tax=Gordonia spumicola TaxID=589161 RepID=A0A7I9VCS1_9ACTN|nr:MarR family winged helix-turn-helix transcriptional regulator [Gordonia spumicola]GEE03107.1 hypothetical protein nbrc107696_35530 [Gordonia spumicola]
MLSDDDDSIWSSPVYRGLVEEFLRMRKRRSDEYEGAVLDSSAFAILWQLSDGRDRTLRELTDALDLEQSTVNRQVNAAIKRGYVERYEVPGRVSRLHRPTDEGRRAFEHDGLLRVTRLDRVFSDLAPGTPDGLLAQLKAFNDAYDRVLDSER